MINVGIVRNHLPLNRRRFNHRRRRWRRRGPLRRLSPLPFNDSDMLMIHLGRRARAPTVVLHEAHHRARRAASALRTHRALRFHDARARMLPRRRRLAARPADDALLDDARAGRRRAAAAVPVKGLDLAPAQHHGAGLRPPAAVAEEGGRAVVDVVLALAFHDADMVAAAAAAAGSLRHVVDLFKVCRSAVCHFCVPFSVYSAFLAVPLPLPHYRLFRGKCAFPCLSG